MSIPSYDEIATLPRWAKVGFAARCARRVQPLFKFFWPTPLVDHVAAVADATRVAERGAADFDAGYAAGKAADEATNANSATAAAATVARHAADAACIAREASADATTSNASEAGVISCTVHAARFTAARYATDVRRDFDNLKQLAADQHWTDDTPCPPWVFGPMWPDGVPEGWPKASPDERLVLKVNPPPDATATEIADYMTGLYEAMNRLAIANGGSGITLDQFRRMVGVGVPVGEGV